MTFSGQSVRIGEARATGILDSDLTTFTDLSSGRQYSIQEAIDKHYLAATLGDSTSKSKCVSIVDLLE